MDKRALLVIAVALMLLVFFWPKHCGNHGAAVDPDTRYQDCTCIGLKAPPGTTAGGSDYDCYGIPASHRCYSTTLVLDGEPVRYYDVAEADYGRAEKKDVDVACD